jgi:hypothetical protein
VALMGWKGGRGPSTPAPGARNGIDQAWSTPVHGLYPEGQGEDGGHCGSVAAPDPLPDEGAPPELKLEPPLERDFDFLERLVENPPPEPDRDPESPEVAPDPGEEPPQPA